MLKFIKSNSTSSNVSSLSVTNCFSSTYSVYKVILQVDEVGTELAIETRLIDGSGVDSTSNYEFAVLDTIPTGSFSQYRDTSEDEFKYTMYSEGSAGGFFVMDVFNPFSSSEYTNVISQTSSNYVAGSTSTLIGRKYIGIHKVAESITGINIHSSGSSNITNAKLSVYGVKE